MARFSPAGLLHARTVEASNATSSATSTPNNANLSTGQIAGISTSTALLPLLVCGVGFWIIWRRRRILRGPPNQDTHPSLSHVIDPSREKYKPPAPTYPRPLYVSPAHISTPVCQEPPYVPPAPAQIPACHRGATLVARPLPTVQKISGLQELETRYPPWDVLQAPRAPLQNIEQFPRSITPSTEAQNIRNVATIAGDVQRAAVRGGDGGTEPRYDTLTVERKPGDPESETIYPQSSSSDETESDDVSAPGRVSSSDGSLLSRSSGIASALEPYKRRAVDAMMGEFRALLHHTPLLGVSIRAGGSESFGQASGAISRGEGPSNLSSADANDNNKRPRDDVRNSLDHNNGNDPKKFKPGVPTGSYFSPRFACPFYRRNPRKHLMQRSCAGPGWHSVHRVKSVLGAYITQSPRLRFTDCT